MESKGQQTQLPPLCANGCGFYGTVLNPYCSKCSQLLGIPVPSSSSSSSSSNNVSDVEEVKTESVDISAESSTLVAELPVKKDDRCGQCNKKLRLALRMPCKCGGTYCREHLLASEHGCPFDHRSAAQKNLAVNNPVVKADRVKDRL
jgi:hypothetical protein